uniref:Putative ovule protein n=1 Tax=Solanum chacoense TaxID=4108 RepID=A0A0V0HI28_SOLCH
MELLKHGFEVSLIQKPIKSRNKLTFTQIYQISLKSSENSNKTNEIFGNLIRASELQILTKVKSCLNALKLTTQGLNFLVRTRNLKRTSLLDQIMYSKADENDEILFGDL